MATNIPPVPGGAPPRKKTNPLVWVLVGILCFFLLIGIALTVGAYFVYHKAKEVALTSEKNPGRAAAKLLAALNPDVEVVSTDEDHGLITIRDKRTGKTVTINFEDAKKGRISFEEQGKETVTLGGGPVRLPGWFPSYPGASAAETFSSRTSERDVTSFQFTTKDSVDQVARFYESALKNAGLKVEAHLVTENNKTTGGVLTSEDEAEGRKAVVHLNSSGSGTDVLVSLEVKK